MLQFNVRENVQRNKYNGILLPCKRFCNTYTMIIHYYRFYTDLNAMVTLLLAWPAVLINLQLTKKTVINAELELLITDGSSRANRIRCERAALPASSVGTAVNAGLIIIFVTFQRRRNHREFS